LNFGRLWLGFGLGNDCGVEEAYVLQSAL